MEINNPKYKNQGIHVINTIFTVEKGVTKVLLVRRNNEPYKGSWALVGGAIYNDELLIDGALREIKEKTGITEIKLKRCGLFDEVHRSPVMRMIAVSYLGVIDSKRVEYLKTTTKTIDADWFPIDKIPKLAYDHNNILNENLECLKKEIEETDILRGLFPEGFTIPEIQKVYEAILNIKFDRRNFRKRILDLNLLEDTEKLIKFEGKKPAKLYKFK